ncbi:GNAT family N-acetyltransferase [Chitinibacter tainanensis]|uniref:GNAT family N-acetyltransferase n=1 Tax=Chitinibacter tainanensis TaxID=230667 RepID=UPI0023546A7C|nr:GNAT family N-acetyltransferase [Chitinibacter tainanensis]
MIDQATQSDLTEICTLLLGMQGETSFAQLSVDLDRLVESVNYWLNSQQHCVFVDRRDGKIIGIFAGCVSDNWFSKDLTGYDIIFYIQPAHRGGIGAYKLAYHWKDWCISKGVKALRPATSTGADCGQFYERLGFKPQGKTYLMEV